MAAFAKILLPKIQELVRDNDVVLDGLYSWDEYHFLEKELGKTMKTIAIVTDKKLRYKRLSEREIRPLTKSEAKSRDLAEIDNIAKAPPIAYADYFLLNNGSVEDYRKRLEEILKEI